MSACRSIVDILDDAYKILTGVQNHSKKKYNQNEFDQDTYSVKIKDKDTLMEYVSDLLRKKISQDETENLEYYSKLLIYALHVDNKHHVEFHKELLKELSAQDHKQITSIFKKACEKIHEERERLSQSHSQADTAAPKISQEEINAFLKKFTDDQAKLLRVNIEKIDKFDDYISELTTKLRSCISLDIVAAIDKTDLDNLTNEDSFIRLIAIHIIIKAHETSPKMDIRQSIFQGMENCIKDITASTPYYPLFKSSIDTFNTIANRTPSESINKLFESPSRTPASTQSNTNENPLSPALSDINENASPQSISFIPNKAIIDEQEFQQRQIEIEKQEIAKKDKERMIQAAAAASAEKFISGLNDNNVIKYQGNKSIDQLRMDIKELVVLMLMTKKFGVRPNPGMIETRAKEALEKLKSELTPLFSPTKTIELAAFQDEIINDLNLLPALDIDDTTKTAAYKTIESIGNNITEMKATAAKAAAAAGKVNIIGILKTTMDNILENRSRKAAQGETGTGETSATTNNFLSESQMPGNNNTRPTTAKLFKAGRFSDDKSDGSQSPTSANINNSNQIRGISEPEADIGNLAFTIRRLQKELKDIEANNDKAELKKFITKVSELHKKATEEYNRTIVSSASNNIAAHRNSKLLEQHLEALLKIKDNAINLLSIFDKQAAENNTTSGSAASNTQGNLVRNFINPANDSALKNKLFEVLKVSFGESHAKEISEAITIERDDEQISLIALESTTEAIKNAAKTVISLIQTTTVEHGKSDEESVSLEIEKESMTEGDLLVNIASLDHKIREAIKKEAQVLYTKNMMLDDMFKPLLTDFPASAKVENVEKMQSSAVELKGKLDEFILAQKKYKVSLTSLSNFKHFKRTANPSKYLKRENGNPLEAARSSIESLIGNYNQRALSYTAAIARLKAVHLNHHKYTSYVSQSASIKDFLARIAKEKDEYDRLNKARPILLELYKVFNPANEDLHLENLDAAISDLEKERKDIADAQSRIDITESRLTGNIQTITIQMITAASKQLSELSGLTKDKSLSPIAKSLIKAYVNIKLPTLIGHFITQFQASFNTNISHLVNGGKQADLDFIMKIEFSKEILPPDLAKLFGIIDHEQAKTVTTLLSIEEGNNDRHIKALYGVIKNAFHEIAAEIKEQTLAKKYNGSLQHTSPQTIAVRGPNRLNKLSNDELARSKKISKFNDQLVELEKLVLNIPSKVRNALNSPLISFENGSDDGLMQEIENAISEINNKHSVLIASKNELKPKDFEGRLSKLETDIRNLNLSHIAAKTAWDVAAEFNRIRERMIAAAAQIVADLATKFNNQEYISNMTTEIFENTTLNNGVFTLESIGEKINNDYYTHLKNEAAKNLNELHDNTSTEIQTKAVQLIAALKADEKEIADSRIKINLTSYKSDLSKITQDALAKINSPQHNDMSNNVLSSIKTLSDTLNLHLTVHTTLDFVDSILKNAQTTPDDISKAIFRLSEAISLHASNPLTKDSLAEKTPIIRDMVKANEANIASLKERLAQHLSTFEGDLSKFENEMKKFKEECDAFYTIHETFINNPHKTKEGILSQQNDLSVLEKQTATIRASYLALYKTHRDILSPQYAAISTVPLNSRASADTLSRLKDAIFEQQKRVEQAILDLQKIKDLSDDPIAYCNSIINNNDDATDPNILAKDLARALKLLADVIYKLRHNDYNEDQLNAEGEAMAVAKKALDQQPTILKARQLLADLVGKPLSNNQLVTNGIAILNDAINTQYLLLIDRLLNRKIEIFSDNEFNKHILNNEYPPMDLETFAKLEEAEKYYDEIADSHNKFHALCNSSEMKLLSPQEKALLATSLPITHEKLVGYAEALNRARDFYTISLLDLLKKPKHDESDIAILGHVAHPPDSKSPESAKILGKIQTLFRESQIDCERLKAFDAEAAAKEIFNKIGGLKGLAEFEINNTFGVRLDYLRRTSGELASSINAIASTLRTPDKNLCLAYLNIIDTSITNTFDEKIADIAWEAKKLQKLKQKMIDYISEVNNKFSGFTLDDFKTRVGIEYIPGDNATAKTAFIIEFLQDQHSGALVNKKGYMDLSHDADIIKKVEEGTHTIDAYNDLLLDYFTHPSVDDAIAAKQIIVKLDDGTLPDIQGDERGALEAYLSAELTKANIKILNQDGYKETTNPLMDNAFINTLAIAVADATKMQNEDGYIDDILAEALVNANQTTLPTKDAVSVQLKTDLGVEDADATKMQNEDGYIDDILAEALVNANQTTLPTKDAVSVQLKTDLGVEDSDALDSIANTISERNRNAKKVLDLSLPTPDLYNDGKFPFYKSSSRLSNDGNRERYSRTFAGNASTAQIVSLQEKINSGSESTPATLHGSLATANPAKVPFACTTRDKEGETPYSPLDNSFDGIKLFFNFIEQDKTGKQILCLAGDWNIEMLQQVMTCCLATGRKFQFGDKRIDKDLNIHFGKDANDIDLGSHPISYNCKMQEMAEILQKINAPPESMASMKNLIGQITAQTIATPKASDKLYKSSLDKSIDSLLADPLHKINIGQLQIKPRSFQSYMCTNHNKDVAFNYTPAKSSSSPQFTFHSSSSSSSSSTVSTTHAVSSSQTHRAESPQLNRAHSAPNKSPHKSLLGYSSPNPQNTTNDTPINNDQPTNTQHKRHRC